MEQEVRRRKVKKLEERLEFNPGKVFGPEAAKEGELDDLEKSLREDIESAQYRARKGQGGDRSRLYGGGDGSGATSELEMLRRLYSGENRRARGRRPNDCSDNL